VNQNPRRSVSKNGPGRALARLGAVLALLCTVIEVYPAAQSGSEMVVQIKNCVVRSGPSFLSDPAGTLKYSDTVNVIAEDGAWRKVSQAGTSLSGWIHVTAVAPPKAAFKSGTAQAGTRVSSGEVALAGRGFDAEVESKLRQGKKDLNYSAVDRIESSGRTKPHELAAFARKGRLLPKETR